MSNSEIRMHKIFDNGGGIGGCGAATTNEIAQALKQMGNEGAHISSNSWSGGSDQALLDAIDHYTTGPHANVDVTIYDENDNPVADVTVDGEICDSNANCQTFTATTDSSGITSYKWKQAGSGTYTTCVNDVTHSSLTYDSSQDHAADGNCETETI